MVPHFRLPRNPIFSQAPTAPFFRFPALRHPPEMVTYLGQRKIAVFSCRVETEFGLLRHDLSRWRPVHGVLAKPLAEADVDAGRRRLRVRPRNRTLFHGRLRGEVHRDPTMRCGFSWLNHRRSVVGD